MNRRIVIRLDSRKMFTQVQFNMPTTKKINQLVHKEGCTKGKFAINVLKKAFNTEDTKELKERIIYASNTMDIGGQENQRIASVCKIFMKRAIDSY